MIAHKMLTTNATIMVKKNGSAVKEAVRLVNEFHTVFTTPQRWVCEACGMVHTANAPEECESCGVTSSLVRQAETHREMNNHW